MVKARFVIIGFISQKCMMHFLPAEDIEIFSLDVSPEITVSIGICAGIEVLKG